MAHIGTPIAGDSLYGAGFGTKANAMPEAAADALKSMGRQALHAATLRFRHPVTGNLRFRKRIAPGYRESCIELERAVTKLTKN